MPSLYRRLFTYRERENRSPLEDFLTEALADLLNRLPDAQMRDAVALLLGRCPDALIALKAAWAADAPAQWTTQRAIPGGQIPDLVMELAGRPFLVLENKIGAGFQEHGTAAAGEGGRRHQLATYGQWLAREANETWGGALVLLTHWTPAPANFATDTEAFGSRHRSSLRWSDFCRWLTRLGRGAEETTTDWARLAAELVVFLKEENMDSELATGTDIAALQIYLASADRLRNTVERIWAGSESIWRPICIRKEHPLEVSTEYSCAWKFRYLSRPDLSNGYLAVGIRCPSRAGYWSEVSEEDAPYLFVEVAADDFNPAIERLTLPATWSHLHGVKLAKLLLRNLPTDPDRLIAEGEAWVRERMAEAAAALVSHA